MSEQKEFDTRILESEILEAIHRFEAKTGIAVANIRRKFLWSASQSWEDRSIFTTGIEIEYQTNKGQ